MDAGWKVNLLPAIDALSARPDAPVLLVCGPTAAVAAAELLPGYVVGSWATEDYSSTNGGGPIIDVEALSVLVGRKVDLWTSTRAGRWPHDEVVRLLFNLRCQIRLIEPGPTELMEPGYAKLIGYSAAELLTYARSRVKEVTEENVPRGSVDTSDEEHDLSEPPEPKKIRRKSKANAAAIPHDAQSPSAFVSWEALGLAMNGRGQPHASLENIKRILETHPELINQIWFDEFHQRIFSTLFTDEPTEWADHHTLRLTQWIQRNLRLHNIGHAVVDNAIVALAREHPRHEVREWFGGLTWDGTERLPTFMSDAFGTPQNDYTAAVGRCWFVSMVARIYDPGCKVDYMPVFEGYQGINKTSALESIGGKWFAELHEDVTKKDFFLALEGKMLTEFTELHQFSRVEINRIKGIITCRKDRYRAPFGKHTEDHPRQGVFSGTTNRDDWVTDDTGARRFWPIACGTISLDYLRKQREQFFAEAIVRYKRGESWWDVPDADATEEQNKRRDPDPWTSAVLDWCSIRAEVTTPTILSTVLNMSIEDITKADEMRVGSILRLAGWSRRTIWRHGGAIKIWSNPNPPQIQTNLNI